ncbi:MAG: hypothetical protein V3V00_10105 [Saprospiraceae bacterium]
MGLEWEMADGSFPHWATRILLGQRVHRLFSEHVRHLPEQFPGTGEWHADDAFGGTFGNRRPDAYNSRSQEIWELKPISNRADGPLRNRAVKQVQDYLSLGNRPVDPLDPKTASCGGWKVGDSSNLFYENQLLGYVKVGLRTFRITLRHDRAGKNDGLVFYEAEEISNTARELVKEILEGLARNPWWLLPPRRIPTTPRPRPR